MSHERAAIAALCGTTSVVQHLSQPPELLRLPVHRCLTGGEASKASCVILSSRNDTASNAAHSAFVAIDWVQRRPMVSIRQLATFVIHHSL